MNAGLAAQRDLAIEAEVTPQQACDWRAPVGEVAPLVQPEPTEDLDRQRWVEELPLTPEQRADQALTRETRESSIATYAGTPGEQGGSTPSASRQRDPRASARDKMLARRRDELL
ncbi:hypothetical protein [Pseudomonas arsenicoxydans]|nr:hypothetical protein [Pseudomonas arsenicoxydans]